MRKNITIEANGILLDLDTFTLRQGDEVLRLNPPYSKTLNKRTYLKITNCCNAQCQYCFQRIHGSKKSNKLTDYESLLKRIIQADQEIVIFGGEPFLKQCISDIEYLFSLDENKKFIIFTNGYFGKEARQFINVKKEQFKSIIISVDGLEETHNHRRPLINGNGFLKILANLDSLHNAKIPATIQINIDKRNYHEIYDLLLFLRNKYGTFFPVQLNKVLHSNNELSTTDLLKLYIKIKQENDYPNLFLNSVVKEKVINLLTEKSLSCARCDIVTTRVYDFTNNTIYCCPQLEHSIIGSFNSQNEIILKEKTLHYSRVTMKESGPCSDCQLRCLCEYGCLDDNEEFKADCFENTLDAIKLIILNYMIFLN